MGLFTNPKILYFLRIAQLLISLGFLILVCYAGVHRGWWKNINGALAVGVIASVFTFAVTIHGLYSHHRSNPFAGNGKAFTFVKLGIETLIFLLWIASAVLMLRHKSGCGWRQQLYKDNKPSGPFLCWNSSHDSDNRPTNGIRWTDRPSTTWDIAIAFSFLEIASFILSAVLVFMENRSKGTGGASYA